MNSGAGSRLCWFFCCGLVVAYCLAGPSGAQEARKSEAGGKVLALAPPAEEFELPAEADTFDELLKFVEEIDAVRPAEQTEAAILAHYRKVARTVSEVGDKALELELDDRQAMQAYFLKLQSLKVLSEIGEPRALDQLQKAIIAARNDSRPSVQEVGLKFYVETGFGLWPDWDAAQRQALVDAIVAHVKSSPPSLQQADMVLTVVGFLGDMEAESLAASMLDQLVPHFRESEDPQMAQAIAMLEGVMRMMKLPGNPIELEGTLLDGSKLDWSAYRGKVVLVDFWATWCEPCREEIPNVLAMYKAYHDKGFEVLGISLDAEPEQAKAYLDQYEIPWSTMFSSNEAQRGWDHPMAVRYGITGIPRAILVDRDGKVVSLTARDFLLRDHLKKLLGEPAPANVQ